MDKRAKKRWAREHRPPTARRDKAGDGRWVFHKAVWGDLEVLVMPRTITGEAAQLHTSLFGNSVCDSNTGVVMAAPYQRAMLGRVVVNDGRAVNCDLPPLNHVIWGNSNKRWNLEPGWHAYVPPIRRASAAEKNDVYWEAVQWMIQGQGMTRDDADAQAEQTLIWSPDSIQCHICALQISGLGTAEVAGQARAFGWQMVRLAGLEERRAICQTCALATTLVVLPFPSDAELAEMERD